MLCFFFFFFQAEDGIRDLTVTGVRRVLFRSLFEEGPSRVSPFFVPMYMPNVAAALISMRYGAKGPNYSTVSACASSAHSVGDALELIRHGDADVMIAGGAEAAITPLAVASFANMK